MWLSGYSALTLETSAPGLPGYYVISRTEDAKGRGVLILTVKHRTRKELLQVLDGGASDVVGKVGEVG